MTAELSKRLSEIASLEDDWDGDSAPKPNERSLGLAQKILSVLAWNEIKAEYDVEPDAFGGVTFGFYVRSAGSTFDMKRAYVACGNNGSLRLTLDDRAKSGSESKTWSEDRVLDMAQSLCEFLSK